MFWTDLIPENIAVSKKAHHIGVYKVVGNTKTKVGTIELNNLVNNVTGSYYKFGVLSDVLLNDSESSENDRARSLLNFRNAIDFFKNTENVKFACVCGNMAIDEIEEEGSEFKIPVFCAKGNKDFATDNVTWKNKTMPKINTDAKTVKYQGNNSSLSSNFYFTHDNALFIFLSSGSERGGIYAEKDIRWLHGLLDENRNKRCFVFMHSPMYNMTGNIYPDYYKVYGLDELMYYNNDFNTYKAFKKMIEYYKNVIWFNGETCYSLEAQVLSKSENMKRIGDDTTNGPYLVHVPGCSYCNDINDEGEEGTLEINKNVSQGYVVTVYRNCVVVNGLTFKENDQFVNRYNPIGTFKINIKLATVKSNKNLLDESL